MSTPVATHCVPRESDRPVFAGGRGVFFLEGIALDDPGGRLEGAGNMVRSIRLDDRAAILDDPYIRGLMTQALKVADADLKSGRGQVVLKSKVAARRV